jgi:hypothetical protein
MRIPAKIFHKNTLVLHFLGYLMSDRRQGMPITDLSDEGISWRKASLSAGNGECIEVAAASGQRIFIRDSKDPDGPILTCSAETFRSFLDTAKSEALSN